MALPLCYHGAISKQEGEVLLAKKNKDGAYLLRDSETIRGALCLCVLKKNVVHTYRVFQNYNGHYALVAGGDIKETFFKSLDDLIRHYKRKRQGLVMHLRHSVKRKTAFLIRPPASPKTPSEDEPQPSLEAELDYENLPSSDYVKVLPD